MDEKAVKGAFKVGDISFVKGKGKVKIIGFKGDKAIVKTISGKKLTLSKSKLSTSKIPGFDGKF